MHIGEVGAQTRLKRKSVVYPRGGIPPVGPGLGELVVVAVEGSAHAPSHHHGHSAHAQKRCAQAKQAHTHAPGSKLVAKIRFHAWYNLRGKVGRVSYLWKKTTEEGGCNRWDA